MNQINRINSIICVMMTLIIAQLVAQTPYKRGTTAANFLEVGYGGRNNAMGDVGVCTISDASALYWNPAGLALVRQTELQFAHQPWIADINTSFAAVAVPTQNMGTFSVGYYKMDFGREEVTTMDMQDGTGEHFSADDMCLTLAYGRKLAQWFSFGASGKLITSSIWHTNAHAFAMDLGAIVNTFFFSPTGQRSDGLSIGMSISNYGTRMRYDGMDLLQPIDPTPDSYGDYDNVPGKYDTQAWELPLLFRIGFAVHPMVTKNSRLTIEVNALHPNNNQEYVNAGGEFAYNIAAFGTFYLRGGYKGLFMEDSEYGLSMGGGLTTRLGNRAVRLDYAFRDMGIFGGTHAYTVSFLL